MSFWLVYCIEKRCHSNQSRAKIKELFISHDIIILAVDGWDVKRLQLEKINNNNNNNYNNNNNKNKWIVNSFII